MLPTARSTPVSQSSMSAAELRLQNLLGAFSQVRLSLKGSEERQVSPWAVIHAPANQLQRRRQLSLRKLVHQVVELLTHRAHRSSVRTAGATARLEGALSTTPSRDYGRQRCRQTPERSDPLRVLAAQGWWSGTGSNC